MQTIEAMLHRREGPATGGDVREGAAEETARARDEPRGEGQRRVDCSGLPSEMVALVELVRNEGLTAASPVLVSAKGMLMPTLSPKRKNGPRLCLPRCVYMGDGAGVETN